MGPMGSFSAFTDTLEAFSRYYRTRKPQKINIKNRTKRIPETLNLKL